MHAILQRLITTAGCLQLCLGFAAQAQTTTTVEYIHTDALGSPVAVTNEAGQVIERTQWEPYGAAIGKPAYDGPGYTGHVMDGATGLTYMQQRYYDPGIGRFLSVDPVTVHSGTGANFNRYWYANNNPYRFTDPDGRAPSKREEEPTTGSHIRRSVVAGAMLSNGRMSSTPSFSTGNEQERFNAADAAVRSVEGTVSEIKHKTEDSAAKTFEHVFQPISSRFGVEISAGIEGRLNGGFYLIEMDVGHIFYEGIGYTVSGGFGGAVPTIHTHPILISGERGRYYPFSPSDLNWFGASPANKHYVSEPGGLYRFNGLKAPVTSIPRLKD